MVPSAVRSSWSWTVRAAVICPLVAIDVPPGRPDGHLELISVFARSVPVILWAERGKVGRILRGVLRGSSSR